MDAVYTSSIMAKKKSTQTRKTKKALKKRAQKVADPEWEFVEERFSGSGVDFSALAQKFGSGPGL